MKFQRILWDNDGVLVDTERYYLQACREALASVNLDLSDAQFATMSLSEGRSVLEIAEQAGSDKEVLTKLKSVRNHRYNELLQSSNLAVEGAENTLISLFGKINMAIVTSSLHQHFQTIHAQTGFLKYIDFYLTREDYTMSKPSPEPYLSAVAKSAQQLEEILVIEDSPRGLAAAKKAGLTCWIIPNQYSEIKDFSAADKILDNICELPGLLL